MGTEKVTVQVEFEIGTPEQVGGDVYNVAWIEGQKDDMRFDIMTGQAMGHPFMDATGRIPGVRAVYARAHIADMCNQIFAALEERLKADG